MIKNNPLKDIPKKIEGVCRGEECPAFAGVECDPELDLAFYITEVKKKYFGLNVRLDSATYQGNCENDDDIVADRVTVPYNIDADISKAVARLGLVVGDKPAVRVEYPEQ